MTGRSLGISSMPETLVCIPRAGIDSATSAPPAITTATTGRRITRSIRAPQTRDSVAPVRRRPRNGIRPLLMRSPSSASAAGRTVSEPRTATATTRIVPSPIPMKIVLPVTNMPAIATITVRPEISTARPEVAAAMSRASSLSWPFARSSRSRRM